MSIMACLLGIVLRQFNPTVLTRARAKKGRREAPGLLLLQRQISPSLP
jgi:hypothetical protein